MYKTEPHMKGDAPRVPIPEQYVSHVDRRANLDPLDCFLYPPHKMSNCVLLNRYRLRDLLWHCLAVHAVSVPPSSEFSVPQHPPCTHTYSCRYAVGRTPHR